jgi:hypothetical protein
MTKRNGLILFVLLAAAFLALNRGAYQGYFQDDEMESLSWTHWSGAGAYLKVALSPLYQNSFRAVGFFYYHVMEQWFGLDYPKYVAVLQVLHLLNVWMLWLLMRRMGTAAVAVSAGCLFFALHMALFDAVWKPMYVFDVLCATFCLLSLLLWARGNWILSFASFWLAYKAKELAVMLPAVLLCYELWFGSRRWKQLAPFVAGSLSFALQALVLKPTHDGDYVFHFSGEAFAKTAPYYASQVFLFPYLGFLLPTGVVAARNRRAWFGLAMMSIFFFPLIWLPARVFSAYCYLPFCGLAVAVAGMVEATHPAVAAALFLLWAPLDLQSLRAQRNDTLRRAVQAREWITTLARFAATRPAVDAFVYQGMPEGFHIWGMEGAAKYYFRRLELAMPPADSPEGTKLQRNCRTAILSWDGTRHKLDIHIATGSPAPRPVEALP